ncbi:hypothetical protein DLNHIDIE_02157 [Acidithiobacillus thiooxidans ATCC 19377]|uniref:Uncharacterized protein n=1 Tax=Acidithiobacillus thiooxidans ATCC 19377 TaxID=637390 RepID=A0A543Q7G9_ACITH|nr:hypothetical protein DLNHIDIE_02157 [Acidithiobacillus thiooxidans ATCC 19377]
MPIPLDRLRALADIMRILHRPHPHRRPEGQRVPGRITSNRGRRPRHPLREGFYGRVCLVKVRQFFCKQV